MAIRTRRFPEYDVNLYVMSGKLTGEETIRFYAGLRAPEDAARWITYFDPGLDLSGLDIASLPQIKRTIALKQRELFPGEPAPRVLVCSSCAHEDFFYEFWRGYVVKGDVRPIQPAIVSSLETAYDRLGLPNAARAAIRLAISDLDAAAPDGSQRMSSH